jgi:MarR family 2-MHQ and catechol resistance regulon transcriptional repressor
MMPTHYQGTLEEIRCLNTFIKLTRAVDSLSARLSRRSTIEELTSTQFGVLESLYHLGSMCPGEISKKVLKSSGNITLVIDNLEKRGLVRRVRDQEDRRMIMVSITQRGQDLIRSILPGHVAAIVEEMNVLTPDEQEQLGGLCKKLGKTRD